MHPYRSTYIFLGLCVLLFTACRQAKYVQDDSYLLHANEVEFVTLDDGEVDTTTKHQYLSAASMEGIIRPAPNKKLRLWVYNRIDTTRHANQVRKKKKKYARKNEKRADKEKRKNEKRIAKARAKGKDVYKPKVIKRKTPRLGWREWVRTSWGEPPVLLDTFRVRKSREQLEIYLRKKGFRYGSIRDTIIYNEKKQKATPHFYVSSGQPYLIKQITFDSIYRNRILMNLYSKMIKEEGSLLKAGDLLDEDMLDDERERYAQYCRNNAIYGFNKKYVNFEVDTTKGDHEAIVKFLIKQKRVPRPDDSTRLTVLRHKTYRVKDVTYRLNNRDTSSFGDNWEDYKARCAALGIEYDVEENKFPLLDTIHIYRKGTFIYNYKPFLKPDLLDAQNFLEITHPDPKNVDSVKYYKEYYIERTYRTMNKLDVFQTISSKVVIDPSQPLEDSVLVSYDLLPKKRQSFMIEPRTTNTNGILGISGAITYTNRNLFRGAQRLETSLIGGMEAQPSILNDTTGGSVRFTDIINTFEIGPTLSLTFPRLVPMGKKLQNTLSKRLYPSTTYKSSLTVQQRPEFLRIRGNFLYNWNFKQGKTQAWEVSLMDFNFVSLSQDEEFQETLEGLNDPFLLNSYSDHLTTAFAVNWHFNNRESNRRKEKQNDGKRNQGKHMHDINVNVMTSGALMYALKIGENDTNSLGQWTVRGVPYSTFLRFDIQYIINQYINKKSSLAYRALIGAGDPYGNSPSMPYEYAFTAGGSNDIRAFQARTMAPGSTQKYIDPSLPLTQIGDMRLEANLEYRFKMAGMLEGALFADVGNIWLISSEDSDGAFRWASFYRQLAIGAGFGLRFDLDFLVVRLDAAVPIHNPYLPETERWITKLNKPIYLSQIDDVYEEGVWEWTNPHRINISFGIGYPF